MQPAAPSPALPPEVPGTRARRGLRARDLVLPVAISLGALAVIGWQTWDGPALRAAAGAIRPATLLLALGALGVQWLAGGMRLHHVSRGAIARAAGVRGQLTWDFMSAVTPSAMGGGPFAAFVIARANRMPVGEMTAVLLFIILTDQLWFAMLIAGLYVAAGWLPVFPTEVGAAVTGLVGVYMAGLLAWFAFSVYATMVRPELLERAAGAVVRLPFLRRFETRVRDEASAMRRRVHTLRGQPLRFYAIAFFWSMLHWTARYSVPLLVALSFTRDLRPVLYLLRTAGLWLTGLALPTPGGSGGIEALFLVYLAPLLPDGLGAPVLLTWRLISYHLVIVLGLVVAGATLRTFLHGSTPSGAPHAPPSDA